MHAIPATRNFAKILNFRNYTIAVHVHVHVIIVVMCLSPSGHEYEHEHEHRAETCTLEVLSRNYVRQNILFTSFRGILTPGSFVK